MTEYLFIGFAIIILFAFALEYWPRSMEQEHSRLYSQWLRSCRRRGLSGDEMETEHRFRRAMVRFRRRVSEEAVSSPRSHAEIIKRVAADEAANIARFDKKAARRFLQVIERSPLGDLYYPDARNAVYEAAIAHGRSIQRRLNHDDLAALRTV